MTQTENGNWLTESGMVALKLDEHFAQNNFTFDRKLAENA